jgi:DinB family protein
MSANAIEFELMGHLEQMFQELHEIIECFPEDLWQRREAEDMMHVPAFIAHHAVWCIVLPHLLRVPEEARPSDLGMGEYERAVLPSRAAVLKLLAEIREYARAHYPQPLREELGLGKPDVVGRITYTLVHTRQHMGQLTQLLKEHDIAPSQWYPIR